MISQRARIPPQRQHELGKLLDRLGIVEREAIAWVLLDRALVHPTMSSTDNNDRLEFIGDSVLRLSVSLFLQDNYSTSSVGELAALRSQLVSDRVLAEIADGYDLDRFLLMSKSARNDPKSLRTRLADALEAILAALYLSTGDLKLVRSWLEPHLVRIAQQLQTEPALGNYKVALQEHTQGRWRELPQYKTHEAEGGIFIAEVWFQERCWGTGEGSSIKAAHQAAARTALQTLSAEPSQEK